MRDKLFTLHLVSGHCTAAELKKSKPSVLLWRHDSRSWATSHPTGIVVAYTVAALLKRDVWVDLRRGLCSPLPSSAGSCHLAGHLLPCTWTPATCPCGI